MEICEQFLKLQQKAFGLLFVDMVYKITLSVYYCWFLYNIYFPEITPCQAVSPKAKWLGISLHFHGPDALPVSLN